LHEVFLPIKNKNLIKKKLKKKGNLTIPSRSIVARTCSEPGVTVKIDFALIPLSIACCAILADRVISSYELLVQLPIRPLEKKKILMQFLIDCHVLPTRISVGHLFFSAS
jgi:hypothetical protein